MKKSQRRSSAWFAAVFDRVLHPRRHSQSPNADALSRVSQSEDGRSESQRHQRREQPTAKKAEEGAETPSKAAGGLPVASKETDDQAVITFSQISDTWNDAYEELKKDELTSQLMERYEQELAKQMSISAVPDDKLGRLKQMEGLAKAKEEELEAGTWKVKFANSQFAVRDLMVPLVSIIQWSKEYVGQAVDSSGVLPAAAAWAGICLLLPLILRPSEQSAARMEALEKMSSIICESCLRESTYIQRFGETAAGIQNGLVTAHTTYRTKIKDLYKGILTFQASNVCFLSDGWAKQRLKDFTKWDDWHKMVGTLEEMNSVLQNLDTQWLHLRQEEEWQEWKDWRSKHKENMKVSEAIKSEMERIATAITSAQQNADRRRILEWLRTEGKHVNPSTFYQEYADARADSADTGSWLLDLPTFRSWKETANSFLWLRGKVGSGKSVLSSKIIEHLESNKNDYRTVVAYYYFTYKEQETQKRKNLTISLIRQLCGRRPDTPQALLDLWNSQETQGSPREKLLDEALQAVIRDFDHVFIVLDGLDECPNDDRRHGARDERMAILRLISFLRGCELTNLHLAAVSRPEPDIEDEVLRQASARSKSSFTIDLSMEACAKRLRRDISIYIDSELKAVKFRSLTDASKHTIREALIRKGQGMFRYVALQMPEFHVPVTENLISEVLQNLPADLNETYKRVLRRVSNHQRKFAACALRWVAFSRVPLSRTALVEAVLVDMHYTSPRILETKNDDEKEEDYGEQPFSKGDKFEPQQVKDLLPGLLEERDWKIDEWGSMVLVSPSARTRHDPVIVATHFSLVEYLKSTEVRQDPDDAIRAFFMDIETANEHIAVTCLRYLAFAAEKEPDADQPQEPASQTALLSYAAANGLWHAEALERERWSPLLCKLVLGLFPLERQSKILAMLNHLSPALGPPRPESSLLYAIARGLWQMAVFLAEHASKPSDLDFPDALHGRTPLSWAAGAGRLNLVQLLLEKGAKADARAAFGRTPLSYAAEHGHEEVIKLLLAQEEVDPDSKSDYMQTPLYKAAMGGHTRVVNMLLDRGADPDISSRFKQTPLIWAAARGHEDVVKLLISTGQVDVNSRDEERQTPLSWAAAYGHPSVVETLLRGGAQVQTQDILGRTPLYLARVTDADGVVRLLEEAMGHTENLDAENGTEDPDETSGGLILGYRDLATSSVMPEPQSRPIFSGNTGQKDLELRLPLAGEGRVGDSLYDLLMKSRTSLPNSTYFWTDRVLQGVLTRSRVAADLKTPLGEPVDEDVVEKICPIEDRNGSDDGDKRRSGSIRYTKIYAILVLLDERQYIREFIGKGFSDECLPVGGSGPMHRASPEETSPTFPELSERFKRLFATVQWRFCTPYFDMGTGQETKTYIFDDENLILPFSVLGTFEGGEKTDYPTPSRIIRSGRPVKIEIDPLSHGFHDILSKMGASETVLVLKMINVRMEHELESRGRDHYRYPRRAHLIPVLARYFIGGDLYRIYPCASGNLLHLWEARPRPVLSAATVRWLAAQLVGILDGVSHLKRSTRVLDYAEPNPSKILWFKSFGPLGRLIISDLTIVGWYTMASAVTKLSPMMMGDEDRHGEYGPPERSNENAPTWALGCVFLELITWLVGGKNLLEKFQRRRQESKRPVASSREPGVSPRGTGFFERKGTTSLSSRVRPEVTSWFDVLHMHENCTQFVHDALEVLKKEMIVVNSDHRRRASTQQLLKTFERLQNSCEVSTAYCEQPAPWDHSAPASHEVGLDTWTAQSEEDEWDSSSGDSMKVEPNSSDTRLVEMGLDEAISWEDD